MKVKALSILLTILIIIAVLTGCNTQKDQSEKANEAIEATIAETEQETQPETEADQGYYAVDLVNKSLPEIIDIMGGDFDVEYNGRHLIHYTDGGLCIYNDTTLPGFAFFVKVAEGYSYEDLADRFTDLDGVKSDILAGKYDGFYFMGVYDDAKYDEKISANMTYVDVSDILGSYQLLPLVAAATMRQAISYDDKSDATIYYNTPEELHSAVVKQDDGFETFDTVRAREINPTICGIAVFP